MSDIDCGVWLCNLGDEADEVKEYTVCEGSGFSHENG